MYDFGFISNQVQSFSMISMLPKWLLATDGTCSTVVVTVLDYKKAFDFFDDNLILI